MSNTDLIGEFFTGQPNPEHLQPPVSTVAGSGGVVTPSSGSPTQGGENKRLKGITTGGEHDRPTEPASSSKPRSRRKPDPSAANITAPCSECGRRFWSQKALFGHMRCHPERPWRGINPPPHLRRPQPPFATPPPPTPGPPDPQGAQGRFHDMDHEVATCLVMLANGPTPGDAPACLAAETGATDTTALPPSLPPQVNCRFECSSCKKVFGSHQALGGHRASHRNVKGCFAIARNEGEEAGGISGGNNDTCLATDGGDDGRRAGEGTAMVGPEHRCEVCRRAFTSGQALGGHKRCHWERGDEQDAASSAVRGSVPDLNLPPPVENSGSSPEAALDIKLGI